FFFFKKKKKNPPQKGGGYFRVPAITDLRRGDFVEKLLVAPSRRALAGSGLVNRLFPSCW
ncbi:hypothetical protein, partial [Escherichia coli]|uniref:hypothetical protein n=1 Tax=Escherichia coli TaxID=562 RepID=UPI002009E64B